MKLQNKLLWLALFATCILYSCKKDFLEEKSDIALVVPESLDDMQAMMDNDRIMNGSSLAGVAGPLPSLGDIAADNYYLTLDNFNSFPNEMQKQAYLWAKKVYSGTVIDWNFGYRSIFYANNVLAGIAKIQRSAENTLQWENVKGSALFFRAHIFYHLAQVFAKTYDKTSSANDMGIPLRLSPDINEKSDRATNQRTYEQIIADLNEAVNLLPVNPKFKTRPSRPAAYALLARTYLVMEDYSKAKKYADSCLYFKNALMDFNNPGTPDYVNVISNTPFRQYNIEVIFSASVAADVPPGPVYLTSRATIDSNLYNSYSINDLRKTAWFRATTPSGFRAKATYDGTNYAFAGIATDEVYLIRAECNARLNNVTEALNDLNALMIKRWKNNGSWVPFAASGSAEALNLILQERRKELVFRALRWTDLRRLNKQGYNITLKRVLDGQTYILSAGDDRWVFPIPPDVIDANPGMRQNPR
jgi:starch-binding outer membrane protein, SusD/RagB family